MLSPSGEAGSGSGSEGTVAPYERCNDFDVNAESFCLGDIIEIKCSVYDDSYPYQSVYVYMDRKESVDDGQVILSFFHDYYDSAQYKSRWPYYWGIVTGSNASCHNSTVMAIMHEGLNGATLVCSENLKEKAGGKISGSVTLQLKTDCPLPPPPQDCSSFGASSDCFCPEEIITIDCSTYDDMKTDCPLPPSPQDCSFFRASSDRFCPGEIITIDCSTYDDIQPFQTMYQINRRDKQLTLTVGHDSTLGHSVDQSGTYKLTATGSGDVCHNSTLTAVMSADLNETSLTCSDLQGRKYGNVTILLKSDCSTDATQTITTIAAQTTTATATGTAADIRVINIFLRGGLLALLQYLLCCS